VQKKVRPGLEVIADSPPGKFSGKGLGLLCNQASTDSRFRHSRDLIRQRFPGQLRCLFSPQHGFFSAKQDNMIESDHAVDPVSGLEVYSLYGETRKPYPSMFKDIDLLLVDLVDELDLKSVVFFPPVPKSTIPGLAAEADAFIFNLLDAPVFRYGISSNKLFDFMAAARPILFCSDAVNNPVKDASAGITVQPGKPEELAHAIIELVETSYKKRKEMGMSGRQHVERLHGFDVLARKLADTLDRAIGS